MNRKTKFSLLALFLSITIVIVISELMLAMIPNKMSWLQIDSQKPKYKRVKDPNTGWYLMPNQIIDWDPFAYGIKINSSGMRDIERQKEDSDKRVIMLGDSYLRAFEVDYDETFYSKLENYFGKGMLNFGESGHGTTQAYMTYLTRAKDYSSDIVIYFFYINDFSDNNRILRSYIYNGQRSKPFEKAPEIIPEQSNINGYKMVKANFDREVKSVPIKIKIFLFQNLHLYRATKYLYDNVLNFDQNKNISFDQNNLSYIVDINTEKNSVDLAFWQLEKSIELLHQEVTNDNRKLIIVYIPYFQDFVSVNDYQINNMIFDFHPALFSQIKNRLKSTSDNLDVPFLDPTGFFNNFKVKKNLKAPYFIFKDNQHFNEDGHEAMFQFLKLELNKLDSSFFHIGNS